MNPSSIMPKLTEDMKREDSGNSSDSDKESRAEIKKKIIIATSKVLNSMKSKNEDNSLLNLKSLSKKFENGKITRRKPRSPRKNKQPRICGNGQPMPPLAVLNKMYADSENEEITEATAKLPLSPNFIQNIASQLMEKLSKISDPAELIDLLPPPPIVEQKKPAKTGIPYIVGCENRPQISKKMHTNFSKGQEYGVHLNAVTNTMTSCPKCQKKFADDEDTDINISKDDCSDKTDNFQKRKRTLKEGLDDDQSLEVATNKYSSTEVCKCCQKSQRRRRPRKTNTQNVPTQSLFNSRSEKIAQYLKDVCDESYDTDQTVGYGYNSEFSDSANDESSHIRSMDRPPSFSPVPSTSRDNKTIQNNNYPSINDTTLNLAEIDDGSVGSYDSDRTVKYHYYPEPNSMAIDSSFGMGQSDSPTTSDNGDNKITINEQRSKSDVQVIETIVIDDEPFMPSSDENETVKGDDFKKMQITSPDEMVSSFDNYNNIDISAIDESFINDLHQYLKENSI